MHGAAQCSPLLTNAQNDPMEWRPQEGYPQGVNAPHRLWQYLAFLSLLIALLQPAKQAVQCIEGQVKNQQTVVAPPFRGWEGCIFACNAGCK